MTLWPARHAHCTSHHNVCYYVNYVHVQPLQIAQTDLLQGCDELTCDELTRDSNRQCLSLTRMRMVTHKQALSCAQQYTDGRTEQEQFSQYCFCSSSHP